MRVVAFALMVWALSASSCLSAQIHYLQRDPTGCFPTLCSIWVDIVGEIVPGDVQRVKQLYEHAAGMPYKPTELVLRLSSRGGDVDAAIAIGRYMREKQGRSIVPVGGECFSACVLIIAGAVERESYGRIGIHRPYFAHIDTTDAATIRSEYRKMLARISKFLGDVDVPIRLAEMMISTPPEQMRLLSETELSELMLEGTDPAFDEQKIAVAAKLLGITSVEYRKRQARSKLLCTPMLHSDQIGAWVTCDDAIMTGRK